MKKDHPFYCHEKQCRKSAWKTPEYMEQADWRNASRLVEILEGNDVAGFVAFINKVGKRFFDMVLGWPEGYNYCLRSYNYCVKSAMPGMIKHDLPKLKSALLTVKID